MADRPNILVIHADQHRFDCLGAYGNPDVLTPNIDALADDGVLYRNCFCPFPVCTPSRYSLLSGLYVRQHGGWSNHCTLPQGTPTFASVLRTAGYRTAAVGKMHFTPTYLDVGFDTMLLAEQNGPGRYDDDYHRYLMAEGLCPVVDLMDQEREFRANASDEYWDTAGAMESDLDEEHHSTTWVAERALDVLREWRGGGNLLMAGFVKPHHPFDPPAPWSQMYDPDALHLLPGWLDECPAEDLEFSRGYFPQDTHTEARVRGAMAMYYATISQIDHHVGRFVKLLKDRGLYDNTLIVYTSDHGDYMGYRHMLLKGNHMYDPLVKIPFIVKFPGSPRAGEVSEALVSTIDAAPLILRTAGATVPRTMAGIDLTRPEADRDFVFAEQGHAHDCMARSKDGKLLVQRDEAKSAFYDLRTDPLELQNRYHDPACADDIARHRNALARWAVFGALSPVHLDEEAPVIPAPNVRSPRDGHRPDEIDYFRTRMAAAGCPPKDN